jgi:hypothetical protein
VIAWDCIESISESQGLNGANVGEVWHLFDRGSVTMVIKKKANWMQQ